jgi:glycosyltransferase involved in cell wall biosynthesis
MRETPEITALMLYYGRRNLAEEAVESFLRQTYPHKRLLIVNTHPDPVHFEQEYPNIEVHNIIPDTFKNLNEKYNYAFSQIKTNWWCPWDSDDIWLPWHFENLVKIIPGKSKNPVKVGIPKALFSFDNIIGRVGWNMWTNCIYETFDKNGDLFPACDDTIVKNCDSQILFLEWERYWLDLRTNPYSFIFRWGSDPHGSGVTGEDAPVWHKKLRAAQNQIRNPEPFRPHWDRDYVQDVEDFTNQTRKEQDEACDNLRSNLSKVD